ncbi:carboxylesterase family protein [Agrobacterium tumefaciens]|nr:carboxylesterase family protein [Agrobacterium tumefaciens]
MPVLVWIYGGGFLNGGASPPTYSGAELAKQGIVFVSFNYRVGRFGFFMHPELTHEAKGEPLGNYGFMDQIAALNWVKRNIHAFGGNAEDVTIVGESAGGMSIHTLLTSPMTKNLFHKAVIQSGGDGKLMMADKTSAEQAGTAFAKAKGIEASASDPIAKLRALSAEEVTDGLSMATLFEKPSDGPKTYTLPMYDGQVAVNALAAYSTGRFRKVPIMVGATSADLFGIDGPMIAGAQTIARTLSGENIPVYYYQFSYVAESVRTPETRGASHASEIPFFFRTLHAKYGDTVTSLDAKTSSLASSYLINFVKTGDPNGEGLPAWPKYQTGGLNRLDFDEDGAATTMND